MENSEQTEALEDNSFALSPAPMALSTAGDYAVMSIASTQNSIMLFDYADNGNYTTVLNSQVACAYKPNGSGTTRTAYIKNLGWHFARYGGVAYPDDPLYCIEPWRSYGASTSGNSVDRGVTLDGSGSTTGSNVWYALPEARREAIGLILLYSNQMWDKSVSVTTTKKDSNADSAIGALYYCSSTNPQSVTVTAGSTATVSFANKLITDGVKLVKETNTGANLSGWKIGLYTDSACTSAVSGSPFTTGTDGTATVASLSPGTYYAKEEASNDPYWVCDTSVKTVTVTANGTATVTFSNTHKGRGKIIKTMPDGGSAAGWGFEVRASDNSLIGTFATGEDGTVLTDYLLPGTYTVKEIIPEGSPYTCDAPNPKTLTITAGQTAEVTFTNRLKPGEILIQKVDIHGEPLAGAEFLLEWSEDGQQWQTVTYTDSLDVQVGTCTSEGFVEGKLTTGEDGLVRFTGLSPGSLYRVTETKAPEGYQLLSEPVHEGSIQKDGEYFIQLTVVNAPVFQLPMTGSTGYSAMTAVQVGICVILLIILFRLAKKRR